MKQTAVEWLVEKLSYSTSDGTIISHHKIINKLVEQAKAMEKLQIIEAYNEGQNTPYEYSESNDVNWYDSNNYYKETFKS